MNIAALSGSFGRGGMDVTSRHAPTQPKATRENRQLALKTAFLLVACVAIGACGSFGEDQNHALLLSNWLVQNPDAKEHGPPCAELFVFLPSGRYLYITARDGVERPGLYGVVDDGDWKIDGDRLTMTDFIVDSGHTVWLVETLTKDDLVLRREDQEVFAFRRVTDDVWWLNSILEKEVERQ